MNPREIFHIELFTKKILAKSAKFRASTDPWKFLPAKISPFKVIKLPKFG